MPNHEHSFDLTVVVHADSPHADDAVREVQATLRAALVASPHAAHIAATYDTLHTTCENGQCLIEAQRRDPTLQGFDAINAWRQSR